MFGEERASWRNTCEATSGKADAWVIPARCVGLRIVGRLDGALARKVNSLIDEALAASSKDLKIVAFCDYTALQGADAAGRALIQDKVKAEKDRFEVLHYLVSSKLLGLAVQVAGLWHGIPSKTWTSRALMDLEFVRVDALSKK